MIGKSVLHLALSWLLDVVNARRSNDEGQQGDDAISTLREQYAEGEITEEEFRERKRVLEEN